MTAQEYLEQVRGLEQRINNNVALVSTLRANAHSLSSPSVGNYVQTSVDPEARFVHKVEKIMQLEEKINLEINRLVDLKAQAWDAIQEIEDNREQTVLHKYYLEKCHWKEIATELHASLRTVQRIYNSALTHFHVPADAICLKKVSQSE